MPRSKTPAVSLEEEKARFEEWRQNRKGKAAIPDELWASAVEVARKEVAGRWFSLKGYPRSLSGNNVNRCQLIEPRVFDLF
jgi:hypothetical protein